MTDFVIRVVPCPTCESGATVGLVPRTFCVTCHGQKTVTSRVPLEDAVKELCARLGAYLLAPAPAEPPDTPPDTPPAEPLTPAAATVHQFRRLGEAAAAEHARERSAHEVITELAALGNLPAAPPGSRR